MKCIIHRVVFQATFVVMLAAFSSTVFFLNPAPSFAASGTKSRPEATRTSAVDYAESQIKQLQASLEITTAQQPLWNDLTAVMRENAKDVDALRKERAATGVTRNAVERMKFHSQMTESHLNQLKKFTPVFEAFYVSLSDEQKKSVDETFVTGKYRKIKRK